MRAGRHTKLAVVLVAPPPGMHNTTTLLGISENLDLIASLPGIVGVTGLQARTRIRFSIPDAYALSSSPSDWLLARREPESPGVLLVDDQRVLTSPLLGLSGLQTRVLAESVQRASGVIIIAFLEGRLIQNLRAHVRCC